MAESSMLSIILDILKGFSPQLGLINVDVSPQFNVQVKPAISLADTVTVNLYLPNPDRAKPYLVVTQHNEAKDISEQDVSEAQPKSIAIYADRAQASANLIAREVYYASGTHLIINQPMWWNHASPIRVGQLIAYPVRMDQVKSIETLDERTFDAKLTTEGSLELTLWQDQVLKPIDLASGVEQKFMVRNTSWSARRYSSDQVIAFKDLSAIVMSFDHDLVREAVLISRTRALQPPEYYILVAKA